MYDPLFNNFSNMKIFWWPNIQTASAERAKYLGNKSNFWSVYGINNSSGLFQNKLSLKGFMLHLHEAQCVHDSMNRPKIECITFIYILL